jgi:hypothetical protein
MEAPHCPPLFLHPSPPRGINAPRHGGRFRHRICKRCHHPPRLRADFYAKFPNKRQVQQLAAKRDGYSLNWSHIHPLLRLKSDERDALLVECRENRWASNDLRRHFLVRHPKRNTGGGRPRAPSSLATALRELTDMAERIDRKCSKWNEYFSLPVNVGKQRDSEERKSLRRLKKSAADALDQAANSAQKLLKAIGSHVRSSNR